MRLRVVLVASAALLVGCGAAPYHSTQGARIVRFELRSALLDRTLHETLIVPSGGGAGRPLLVLLHGRSADANQFLGDPLFTELRRLGRRAPVVLLPDGGDHSYWHDRAEGPWGSYVLREAIPSALARTHADGTRIALGGASMGGFGALDLARLHPGRFCAVGGHSAALWPSAGQTAPGAFDDAADFARHDVIGAARRGNPYGRTPVFLDVGRDDGFRFADEELAQALRSHGASVTFRLQPGGHGGWRDRMTEYLRFYTNAFAACRTSGGANQGSR
jgi:S-formylglutathione hydrolase FrmB